MAAVHRLERSKLRPGEDGERRPWVAISKSAVPCQGLDPKSLILLEA